MSKLNEREKRTVKLGVLAVLLIGTVMVVPRWLDRLTTMKTSITKGEKDLAAAQGQGSKQAGLDAIVPVFEMPEGELKQKFLFREAFSEQLKKAGLKTEPLESDTRSSGRYSSFRRLTLSYQGKAEIAQILKLLASLKSNPYLAGVEEMQIKADPKKQPEERKELDFTLVVSTFVK